MAANNIYKPLTDTYSDRNLADPMEPDVEFDVPDEFTDEDVMEMDDGSAWIGPDDPEAELPPIDQIPHNSNLVSYFDQDELTEIATDLISAWEEDDNSREQWKEAYVKGLRLLGMEIEEKSEPFQGASGVYHPLLAEAVVQFQAQAYKELLPSGGPVLTKVLGDETLERLEQATRVQDFMNYLIMDVMEEYDPDMDQLLFYLPLSGSAFKKTYFDTLKNRTVSKFVMAEHLTVPYGTTDLASATRISHDFIVAGNDLLKYQATGFYSNEHTPEPMGDDDSDEVQEQLDAMAGVTGSFYNHDENYKLVEIHTNLEHEVLSNLPTVLDEDEDDAPVSPALPYIITLDPDSNVILSIRRNYAEGDAQMQRLSHFTHYKFLPGLGFYGFGLIHMIGGLTSSVTSILRQLIDAGTFSNLPGGLKVKGIAIDGDNEPIAPGEFRDVDAPTGSIKDAIMTLPYKEPSAVLAALLGVLVESGQRFASIADMQVGDTSGQQQPVGTTIAVLERGTKVMSAIHKRLHYAQKNEFKILVRLIKESLPEGPYPYATKGKDQVIMTKDFDDRVDVLPVSDPNIFSMAQRVMIATQQLQMAQAAPEIHNLREAYRRMYVAMGVTDVETLLKPEEKPVKMTPLEEHRNVLQNKMLTAVPEMNHQAHIEAHIQFLQTPYILTNPAFAANLVQDIFNHVSLIAKQQAQQQMQQMQQQMQQMQQQGQQMQQPPQPPDPAMIELEMMKQIMPRLIPPTPPNPQVDLQKRQLDIEEKDDQMKHAQDAADMDAKERISHEDNVTELIKEAMMPIDSLPKQQ